MSNVAAIQPQRSVTVDMAHRFGMEPGPFEKVLRATVVPGNCSQEQFAAFLLVAKQYNLNPITKEIYAFPAKGGGIQPIVGVDGWMRIMNDHPQFDGMEFEDMTGKDDQIIAIACRIFRKDRNHPVLVTEYLNECKRDSEPWKKWPARMLRHKAAIQCARYAFGFSGIIDPDEYERGVGAGFRNTPVSAVGAPPPPTLKENLKASIEQHDAETGEIMTSPDAENIYESKDQAARAMAKSTTPKGKPKAKPSEIDPDKYLDDLQGKMSCAKTAEDLAEIWQEHLAYNDQLMPPDQEVAETSLDFHRARIEKNAK
jgi:phage recombination protein Bet